jgi:hypothetical protein
VRRVGAAPAVGQFRARAGQRLTSGARLDPGGFSEAWGKIAANGSLVGAAKG